NVVGISAERQELVDSVVEADDRRLAARGENRFGDNDAGFPYCGKQRVDTGTCFEKDYQGNGVAADIEVRNALRYAMIGKLKVLRIEPGEDLAAGIAYCYRCVDQHDFGFDCGVDTFWRLLDGNVRAWDHGAVGGLGEGGRRHYEKCCSTERRGFGAGQKAHHASSTSMSRVYSIRRKVAGRRCREWPRFLQWMFAPPEAPACPQRTQS